MATIAVFIALGGGAIAATQSSKKAPRWAVVSADGGLVRGSGAVSAKRLFAP